MIRFRSTLWWQQAFSLVCGIGVVGAAESTAQTPAAPSAWEYAALLTTNRTTDAGFRDTDGSVTVNECIYELRAFWDVRPGTLVAFGLGGGYWGYDSERLRNDYDIEGTMRGHRARMGGMQMLNQHWGVMLQESIGFGYDGHATLRDGLQSWTYAAPVWARDRDLFIAVGAFIRTKLTGGVSVMPMPTVHWQIDNNWLVKIFDQVDTNSRVTRRIDDALSVGVRLDIQAYQSALAHNTTTDASVFGDTRTMIGAECDWAPGKPGAVLRPFVGVLLNRQITVSNDNGDQLFNERVKPAPVFGLSFYAEF